jgi:hypothetical protein
MTDTERPADRIFATPQPSVALVPHLLTALDPRFLSAIVGINGAKMGVWKLSAPFDENDAFVPYRENVPLSAWGLAYNQGELLACRNIVADESILIVDCNSDEKVLQPAQDALQSDGAALAYQDHPELPKLLAKIGWALIPVGQNLEQALFAATPARRDIVELLKKWCHTNGRAYATVETGAERAVLKISPAPENARRNLTFQEGAEFLNKLALFGISGDEVQASFPDLVAMIKRAAEEQSEKNPE